MNAQEVFTKVATHLLKQGRKSQMASVNNSPTLCLYRGADGTSCAVGCLIADEAYEPELETNNVNNLGVRNALRASGVDDDIIDLSLESEEGGYLLESLQGCHDRYDPAQWPARLATIAESFGLTMPPEVPT